MSTGQLNRKSESGLLSDRRANLANGVTPGTLQALFRTPVPPFHVAFSPPPGMNASHPLFEMHRAANRVYHERVKMYRAKGTTMNAPDLVQFVRNDVMSNLLATEVFELGPIKLEVFRFLKKKKFFAFFPPHREQATAMQLAFYKLYRRKKPGENSGALWVPQE